MNSAKLYQQHRGSRLTRILVMVGMGICLFSAIVGTGVEVGLEAARDAEEQAFPESVPFEMAFRSVADSINWPWELLAALAWSESHYNPKAHSHVGAKGVMQLMPKTGERFGLNDSTFCIPEDNIRAGMRYIRRLQSQFRFVPDSAEQWRFVVASYNAGPAHVHDARRLARKFGDNPNHWNDVAVWLDNLRYEEFYTDSVVQFGSFNADETLKHVRTVESRYRKIKINN